MNLSKEQWGKILSAVIVFIIAVLAVIQPRMAGGQAQAPAGPVPAATSVLGNTYEAVTVLKNFRSLGAATLAEATIPKLSATTITATNIISQAVTFSLTGNGTAAAPAYTFASDPDSGIYRVGANNLGIAVGGALVLDAGAAAVTSAQPVVLPVGSAAAPAATFTGDVDSGLYRVGANDVGVSTNGTLAFDWSATAATSALPVAHPAGTAAAPSMYITGDTNTGLYQVAADDVGISAGGTLRLDVSATAVTSALPVVHPVGSAAAPAATFTGDTNSGVYRVGADDVGISAGGALVLDASATAVTSAQDVTISPDTTGGNAGAKNELSGLPRVKFVALAAGTNGTTETTLYVDDTPTGEFAPIDANVTEANETSIYRFGTASYKAMFDSNSAAGDGFKRTIASDDLEANESIGCMLYPTATVASGDLQILLTDDGGERDFNIGALTANKWNWVEVDISSLAAGTGNAVTEFGVSLTAQGETAQGYLTLYMDSCYKWDATDEEALGTAILQDGVLNVVAVATSAASANTPSVLVEGTDYFVHYETGNDFIVWITDQSANSNLAFIAY